jgi:hypothetical protein
MLVDDIGLLLCMFMFVIEIYVVMGLVSNFIKKIG